MPSAPIDRGCFATSLPPLTPEHVLACAQKMGRYLVGVSNAEGPGGLGDRVSQRYPIRAEAVVALGRAVSQQFYPDALMPAIDEAGDDAADALELHAHAGCWALSRAPDIDRSGGIYAAAGVVCALAAQVKLAQQAALSPQALEADAGRIAHDAVGAALQFLQYASDLQALLDARDDAEGSSTQGDDDVLEITRL